MKILAIETSCDDTGVAVMEDGKLLSNIVSSQIKIHAPYGGVVPNLAQRAHQENLVPVLEMALNNANLRIIANNANCESKEKIKEILNREPVLLEKLLEFLNKYERPDIDLIAVTYGPGLAPCLWVGVNFAKALACAWGLKIIPVNHIEGHIATNWLTPINNLQKEPSPQPSPSPRERELLELPSPCLQGEGWGEGSAICLVVSGGHTQLILMQKFGDYEIIGETRDDAAGEAFDKVAKLLGLGYPGGPAIAKQAEQWKSQKRTLTPALALLDRAREKLSEIKFPRPMINTKDFDFSFSGLKTAVLYFVKNNPHPSPLPIRQGEGGFMDSELIGAICAEFEQAVVDVLVKKTIRAGEKYGAEMIMLSGGVAANELLRSSLQNEAEKMGFYPVKSLIKSGNPANIAGLFHRVNFVAPDKQFCSDNAGMVALAGYWHKDEIKPWQEIGAEANLRI